MLNDLRIKNFRMLEDLHIAKLGRVNLIVGKNSCGKSTVLDALHILASRAHPNLLQDILAEHHEFVGQTVSRMGEEDVFSWAAIENLFPERQFPKVDDQPILIESGGQTLLRLDHEYYRQTRHSNSTDRFPSVLQELVKKVNVGELNETIYQQIKVSFGAASPRFELLDFGEKTHSRFFNSNLTWLEGSDLPRVNVGYVSTQLTVGKSLASKWDRMLLNENNGKKEIEDALRIIQPDVEELNFIQDTFSARARIPIVQIKGGSKAVPLASMGDGMLRVLQLILTVFSARGGFLLIDEFENGLHFTVQEKVWRMIFKLANDLDIQVFASTHSRDCVESFTKVAQDYPEQGILFKLSKSRLTSDNGKVIATVYDAHDLQAVTAMELEVR